MERPKLIGLSLSKCCEEMAEGKVDPKDVKLIIAGTSARNQEEIEKLLREYREYRWPREIRGKASRLARKFFREGKVEQPRNTCGLAPDFDGGGIHCQPIWITNRKTIKWKKELPFGAPSLWDSFRR